MKNKTTLTMKIAVVCALLVIGISACKKTTTGPTGPTGATGATGATGNSNVKLLMFGKDSITSAKTYMYLTYPSTITSNLIDSSVVLVYVYDNYGYWNSLPGMISLGSNVQSAVYFNYTKVSIVYTNADGTSYSGNKEIFPKSKVLIIPSSNFSGHKLNQVVDFKDYKATMKYFGLPED